MPLDVSASRAVAPPLSVESRPGTATTEVALLRRLALALESAGVSYCQWKGHSTAHRWMAGRGDIDLLVAQDARPAFLEIVGELGFKPGLPPGQRQLPGVESFFGFDPAVPRLLHLHVHYRLLLGEYWRTSYRLPVERDVLASAVPGDLFPVPDPTHQFLLFALRMVLLQRGRLLLGAGNRWRRGLQIQLDNLEALCKRERLAALLQARLPTIDVPLLDRCVASLRGEQRPAARALLLHLLRRRLRPYSRNPIPAALLNAAAEKILPTRVRRRVAEERMRFPGGGTVIALNGGDGAGKSTCARELEGWLSADYAVIRAQLGNPPRSLPTMMIGGAVKLERSISKWLARPSRSPTYLELLRHVCGARDRYRLYARVQRFAARGGIAICERYPISEIPSHAGPCIPALLNGSQTAFSRILQSAEHRYYERMRRPDLLFVLRLDPELAVARKTDEPADYVRNRGHLILKTDWTKSGAQVVDAGRSLPEVIDDLKGRVWLSL